MCETGQTRTTNRDQAYDGKSWRVLGLVTVLTPDGVLFGRLEAQARRERADPSKMAHKWK